MKSYAVLFSIVLAGTTLGAQQQEMRARIEADGGGQAKVYVTGDDMQFTRMPLNARIVKGAPYSAETVNESSQMLADGNRISHRTSGRVYRDSQGRERREEDRADGSQTVSIIDPVAGTSYSLNMKTHVAVKTPSAVGFSVMNKVAGGTVATFSTGGAIDVITQQKFEAQLKAMTEAMAPGTMKRREGGRGPDQRTVETLAAKNIEGVRAEGTKTTTTIPADTIGNDLPIVITSEEWTSPDLQLLVLTRHNDPRSGESTYRLVNIIRAEPDASLFQVPADFTVKGTGIRQDRREQ